MSLSNKDLSFSFYTVSNWNIINIFRYMPDLLRWLNWENRGVNSDIQVRSLDWAYFLISYQIFLFLFSLFSPWRWEMDSLITVFIFIFSNAFGSFTVFSESLILWRNIVIEIQKQFSLSRIKWGKNCRLNNKAYILKY